MLFLNYSSIFLYAGTTGKIKGFVRDAGNGEPLAGVNITIEGMPRGAATDIDGYFNIISIHPGKFNVVASYVGYQTKRLINVEVNADLTTSIEFELVEALIEGEVIEIIAERPAIQKDLTASEQGYSAEEIEAAPIENLSDLIDLQAGINPVGSEPSGYVAGSPGDGIHIRGGRENETLFMIDGVKVGDDIYGGSRYIQNTSGSSIQEMKTIIGTFNAEYGGKTGGVISVITKDGSANYAGSLSGYTDKFGIEQFDRNTYQGELSLTGPIPFLNNLFFYINGQARTTDGRTDIFGVDIPDWSDSEGLVGRVDDDDVPDEWKVAADWKDEWNTMAKLIFKPVQNLKLMTSYIHSSVKEGKYKHSYRYRPYAFPWVDTENFGVTLKLVHTLSANTFYELIGSFQATNFFYGIDKTREKKLLYGDRVTYEDYYVSGAIHEYNTDSSQTWQALVNVTSQIHKNHQIKTGLELRRLEVFHRMDMAGGAPVYEIEGEFYESHLAYARRNPLEFSVYLQDKMEFEDIGMIMNLGVRLEYWNPEMEFMELPDLPFTTEMLSTEAKIRFSPRFGISYPVSDRAAFHLAYGHFYQLPRYMELISGLNDRGFYQGRPNLNDPGPGISNPNARPEKTVSYETGVQLQLAFNTTMNVTAFYREMSDLMGVRWMSGGGGFVYLDNVDFGNSKGIEIVLNKRFSDLWSARINYTWSTANISTSSPLTAAQKNRFISYRTFLADWDRPHDLSANFVFSNPSSWAISLITYARSGRPYSTLAEKLNTERMPWEITSDLRISKYFNFLGMQETFYLKVSNLLDRRNIRSVYSETGKWDVNIGEPRHLSAVPTRISDGRSARVGFKLNF
jgi:hypothetical protein